MRSSLSLSFTAILASFAYGFSSQSGAARTFSPFHWRTMTRKENIPTARASSPSLKHTKVTNLSRGGGVFKKKQDSPLKQAQTSYDTGSDECPPTGAAALFGSVWGTGGVLYILAKAVARVMPIAMEPFQSGAVPLSQFELG